MKMVKLKPKYILLGLVALVAVLGGGAALISRSQTQNSDPVVLSQSSSEEITEQKPILEIISGKVEIQIPNNDFEIGANGQELEVGTIIKTDSTGRGVINYPNHSTTRIDHNSQLTLSEFSLSPNKTKVRIDSGRIWNRVAKLLGKDDEFSSETETLVASVRGTSYGHGIQADGSNKISVSRSQVLVDCSTGETPNVNVGTNKKIVTKCATNINVADWGGEEANDEWFNWNLDQDKKLDEKYGIGTYDDAPSPTPVATKKPTPKPTATPAVKAAATAVPTPTAAASTPTPLTITSIEVICNLYSNNPCNPRTDTQIKLTGSGYSAGANPTVTLYSQNPSSTPSSTVPAYQVVVNPGGGFLTAKFNTALYGEYKVVLKQYDQTVESNVSIEYNQ